MNIITNVSPKKVLIASAVICSVGIYLLNFQPTNPSEQTVNSGTVEVTQKDPVRDKTNAKKTTSELIQASARKAQLAAKNITIDYPNITPKKLETPFSSTLVGTDIDGQLKVDENGQVILDIEVKDFFDYFLTATAEVSADLALDELLRVISESLPPEQFLQAQQLLDNYLAYKEQAVALMAQPMLPQDQQTREYQLLIMEDTLAQLRELRRANMPIEQVEAFFGLEEAYEDFTIASVKVQFDDTMSESQKAEMIQYHRSFLPDPIRSTETRVISDSKKNAEVHKSLMSDDEETLVSKLDSHGYSDTQKTEIVNFKRSQAEFDQLYSKYKQAKIARLRNVTNEIEQQEIVNTLQSEYFTTEQQLTQAKVRDLQS
jgi:lipase chaperone LimK